jgi:hypothetical protein
LFQSRRQNSLKNKNSSGYDAISNKIRRLCGHLISKPLSYIFDKSLSLAIFPDRLKYAIIKPLFKNGGRSGLANYRPLWTAFAKLCEITIFRRVTFKLKFYIKSKYYELSSS